MVVRSQQRNRQACSCHSYNCCSSTNTCIGCFNFYDAIYQDEIRFIKSQKVIPEQISLLFFMKFPKCLIKVYVFIIGTTTAEGETRGRTISVVEDQSREANDAVKGVQKKLLKHRDDEGDLHSRFRKT